MRWKGVREKKWFIALWLGLSFIVNLDCELQKCSSFFFTPLGGSVRVELARVGSFLFPKSVRLWLASLFLGQDLFKTEYSDVFQNGSFSPPPCQSRRAFFSDFTMRNSTNS